MHPQRGFSLVETLIAATLVIVALAGLAQLFVIATAANHRTKARTVATILAREKLEELLATEGEVAAGSEFLDGQGQIVGAGVQPPPGTAFVRQWSADPMPAHPRASLLHVWVTAARHLPGGETVRIVSVKASRIPWR